MQALELAGVQTKFLAKSKKKNNLWSIKDSTQRVDDSTSLKSNKERESLDQISSEGLSSESLAFDFARVI